MAHQAVPMLYIPKKNGKLCTVFDLQEQNDNMVKDVTPFPDQDIIRNDMARVAYQSKLDMSEVYEQIRIIPEHVHKCRGSIKNKAIFFFNWPPSFSILSHCLQFQKTQKQEKSRITT